MRVKAKPGGAVWDGPTRLFHWLLVGLFGFSWWSAEHEQMAWHLGSGIVLLALLVFRLLWGIIGSNTARFSQFLKSPRDVLAYVRSSQHAHAVAPTVGHNPLGAYSVIALLILLMILVVSGLFSVDVDGLESGPLSFLASFNQGRSAAHLHGLSFKLLLGLIAIHIVAVVYYGLRGRNLLLPMLTGRDPHLPPGSPAVEHASLLRLIAAVLIAAGTALWVSKGLPL